MPCAWMAATLARTSASVGLPVMARNGIIPSPRTATISLSRTVSSERLWRANGRSTCSRRLDTISTHRIGRSFDSLRLIVLNRDEMPVPQLRNTLLRTTTL